MIIKKVLQSLCWRLFTTRNAGSPHPIPFGINQNNLEVFFLLDSGVEDGSMSS